MADSRAGSAHRRNVASVDVQEGVVSVQMEEIVPQSPSVSGAEAAAEVSLLRGDNVLLTLQRCTACLHGKTQAGWVWAHGERTATTMRQHKVPVCYSKVKARKTVSLSEAMFCLFVYR